MKFIRTWFISIALITCYTNAATAEKGSRDKTDIFEAHERLLASKLIKQEYKLLVNLPKNYDKSDKNYPVVYLLDAHLDYGMLLAIYEQLYFDGDVPDAILVGISWGGEEPNPDKLRMRDFTPSAVKDEPDTGGGDLFLSVIKTELIPFINEEYRTSRQRILVGSSLGGMFTIYAMFRDPELFSGYLSTAPAAFFADEELLKVATSFVAPEIKNKVKLYSVVSKSDWVFPSVDKLHKFLEKKKLDGIEMKLGILNELGHNATKSIGNIRGLQYLFEKNEVTLSQNEADLLIGTYKDIDSEYKTEVGFEDGKLTIVNPIGVKDKFISIGNSQFFLKGPNVTVEFDTGSSPRKMQVSTLRSEQIMTKVE